MGPPTGEKPTARQVRPHTSFTADEDHSLHVVRRALLSSSGSSDTATTDASQPPTSITSHVTAFAATASRHQLAQALLAVARAIDDETAAPAAQTIAASPPRTPKPHTPAPLIACEHASADSDAPAPGDAVSTGTPGDATHAEDEDGDGWEDLLPRSIHLNEPPPAATAAASPARLAPSGTATRRSRPSVSFEEPSSQRKASLQLRQRSGGQSSSTKDFDLDSHGSDDDDAATLSPATDLSPATNPLPAGRSAAPKELTDARISPTTATSAPVRPKRRASGFFERVRIPDSRLAESITPQSAAPPLCLVDTPASSITAWAPGSTLRAKRCPRLASFRNAGQSLDTSPSSSTILLQSQSPLSTPACKSLLSSAVASPQSSPDANGTSIKLLSKLQTSSGERLWRATRVIGRSYFTRQDAAASAPLWAPSVVDYQRGELGDSSAPRNDQYQPSCDVLLVVSQADTVPEGTGAPAMEHPHIVTPLEVLESRTDHIRVSVFPDRRTLAELFPADDPAVQDDTSCDTNSTPNSKYRFHGAHNNAPTAPVIDAAVLGSIVRDIAKALVGLHDEYSAPHGSVSAASIVLRNMDAAHAGQESVASSSASSWVASDGRAQLLFCGPLAHQAAPSQCPPEVLDAALDALGGPAALSSAEPEEVAAVCCAVADRARTVAGDTWMLGCLAHEVLFGRHPLVPADCSTPDPDDWCAWLSLRGSSESPAVSSLARSPAAVTDVRLRRWRPVLQAMLEPDPDVRLGAADIAEGTLLKSISGSGAK